MEFNYRIKGLVIFICCILGLIIYLFLKEQIEHSIVVFLVLLLLFYFLDLIFRFKFKKRHYFFVIFIASAGILFGFLQFYFFYLDKILHFIGGVMLGSVVYHMAIKFNKKKALILVFLIAFFVIVFYEFSEFLADVLSSTNLQGVFVYSNGKLVEVMSKALDTVLDILLGGIGVLVYIVGLRNN